MSRKPSAGSALNKDSRGEPRETLCMCIHRPFGHFGGATFAIMDCPTTQELQQMLAEADWLPDEDREKLEGMLAQFRKLAAELEADPAIDAAELARRLELLRGHWVKYFEACRKVDLAEGDLLEKRADMADSMRNLTMMMLRINHAKKAAIDAGEFTGTWDQLEKEKELIARTDEDIPDLLLSLTAEDIRTLKDEGVL
jgi:uncharacterized membrane protein